MNTFKLVLLVFYVCIFPKWKEYGPGNKLTWSWFGSYRTLINHLKSFSSVTLKYLLAISACKFRTGPSATCMSQ